MNMEENKVNVFDFSSLKKDDRIIVYKDKFMLGDNLGKKIDWSVYGRYLNLYPTKSQSTLVLFCSKGKLNVRINFKDYQLGDSDALVILPNTISQVLEIGDETELIFMAFADNTFLTPLPANEMIDFFKQIQENPVLCIPAEKRDLFLGVYKMLRADMANDDFSCKSEALLGYMQIMTAHAHHWVTSYRKESNEVTEHTRSTQLYMQFMRLVNEYHCQHRDVSFYAEKMCLSPKYMSQVILSVTGRYALDIIKDQVIFEAKALLKAHQHSVQEVAYMLNFTDPSAFGRYFRSEVGCSPRAYMNSEEV